MSIIPESGLSDDQHQLVRDDLEQQEQELERDNVGDTNENEEIDEDSQKPKVYTSQLAALFIIVNVTIGVGLLAMPYSMQSAGIVFSMLIQMVFLGLIIITCIMCTELTVKSAVTSYHDIIRIHCHPFIYHLTQVSIFLLVFGTTVAYIVTIGDQSDRLFLTVTNDPKFCHVWYMNRRFIMSITTLLAIKPLCSARTVDFLKYASFLGILSIGFIFYVVSNEFFNGSRAQDVNYLPKSWKDVATILPVFALGYQCHLSLVPAVSTIRRSEKPKAFVTTTVAMVISAIIYSSISILAVLTFGSKINKDLTESYPGKSAVPTIIIVAIKCVLTLPAAYLPARLSIVDILTNNWSRFARFSEPVRRIGVTIIFLDIALLLALTVPDIVVVVSFLGFLAVMFIFQLPGIAYLNLVKQNRLEKQQAAGLDPQVPNYNARDRMKLAASYFMIVFGSIITVVVLYKSIEGIIMNSPSPPLCVG